MRSIGDYLQSLGIVPDPSHFKLGEALEELQKMLRALLGEEDFGICLKVYARILRKKMRARRSRDPMDVARMEMRQRGAISAEVGMFILAAAKQSHLIK